ncbi:EMILIN-3 [Salminus brasiliensis]|uniref:EMILIN-3 n=1 Tax=Salminus brasiliensis TaxID=930266 RepID=UPI003B8343C9
MLLPCFLSPLLFLSASLAVVKAFGSFNPNDNRFSLYKSGPSPHYSSGKPTARHKNHCAYVVEKSVSYTIQDGVAPFVKAEYNKCTWGKKCPTVKYRMLYRPMYKVIHKTMTELEWRCCPGFTGVGCNAGPAAYGMKAMPPFKGPMPTHKGPMPSGKGPQPSIKGPMPPFKGPMPAFKGNTPSYKGPAIPYKGPMPSYKGPMRQPVYKGNPWDQPYTTSDRVGGYPGNNIAPSYSETSFESNPDHLEPEMGPLDTLPEEHNPLTDDQDPIPDTLIPDDHEPITDYQDPLPDHQSSNEQHPERELIPEAQAPSGDSELNPDPKEDSVTVDRLNRMEEDVQRLSLGLETLRGKVTGLEDHLRTSLREDANRMLSALLSAAPAPATSQHSTVGFGDLPGGAPDIEGMEMVGQFPQLSELAEKVEKLRTELLSKSTELAELRGTVLSHNGTLQKLNVGAVNLTGSQQALETLVESKLGDTRVAILEGFERRVESVEERFMGRATEVRLQCRKDLMEGQEQLEQVLNSSMAGLRNEFRKFHGQLQDLEPEDVCCTAVSGMTDRLVLLERSMDGLNQSQVHLKDELGSHKDHVEGMVEGRLVYVEEKLTKTEKQLGDVDSGTSVKLEACLEEKMKALENRLFAAVEELGNATAPALLEGQAVPTLETEVESLRKRVEVDVDRFQKQLSSLELLCSSSCAPQPVLTGFVAPLLTPEEEIKDNHENLNGQLDAQTERMDRLNATLNSLLIQLSERKEETGLEGEVTLLKVNVHSVNRTLCGLKDTFGKVMEEMGHTNLTWQDREDRLAQQVKGVVQLVGRQASMLGTGERRLTRLKGELQDLRRRLAAELQGCRSTALGVQKEVTEVGGRVARVEGQCGGLARLAEDLELIRGELDKHSDGYLSQVNSTLINHSLQLSELKNGLKNCTGSSGLPKSTDDHIMTTSRPWQEPHTVEPIYPRGDQFTDPTQLRDGLELRQAP